MKSTRPTRIFRAAVIVILATLTGGVVAAPAQAAAFRYWGYFHLEKGAWVFAQTGSAQAFPADGSVEGWRFAVADESSQRKPRATPTFDALCAGTPVTAGNKRVGLVIDYGRPADSADGAEPPAARATCVAVPQKATGSDVLVAAGAKLRLDKSLTCAIDGWPATGCGDSVDPVPAAAASPDASITIAVPSASPSASPDAGITNAPPAANAPAQPGEGSTNSLLPNLGVLAAVLLIAALGIAAWRRRREASDG